MKNSWTTLFFAMAFFVSGIGAKDCGPGKVGSSPPPAEPPPTKPLCMIDPPQGCMAICVGINQIAFTDNCALPGSSTRTALFKETVYENVTISTYNGMPPCAEESDLFFNSLDGVTSCEAGYPPQLYPGQSLDDCTPPPLGCP